MDDIAQQLAHFAAHCEPPPDVYEGALLHIGDAVGIGCVASGRDDIGPALARYLRGVADGPAGTFLGSFVQPADAALVNASLIHSLDFDDTHEGSLVHPSAPIVPAAFAVAGAPGVSGRRLVRAIVVGFEAALALGVAACADFHSRFHSAGYQPSAVCGALGAGLAAGVVLELDETQLVSALAIASTLAGGSSQVISRGLKTKALNVGHAAATGVIAARLAQAGYPAGPALLEEPRGFFQRFAGLDRVGMEAFAALGEQWRTREISIKAYPAGFGEHPFIDMALELRAESGLDGTEVDSVVYGDLEAQIANASEPADEKRRPRTGYQAKFSRYYCIACALRRGRLTVDDFTDEAVSDPAVLALAERTSYAIDTYRWLEARLADGRVLRAERRGSVGTLDPTGVVGKFEANCQRAGLNGPRLWRAIESLLDRDPATLALNEIFVAG